MLGAAAFVRGFALGASLIIAIGAQNAFVLRQGLARRSVGTVVLVCLLCDMTLIAAGVAGMGALVRAHPAFTSAVAWGGAAFLLWYGLRAWRSAWHGHGGLDASNGGAPDARAAALTALGLSLLNPHVYLDTVVLLGALGGREPWPGNAAFALGAMAASALWFTALGYGARLLRPLFAQPRAWRVFDGLIGATMWMLALGLVGRVA